MNMEQLKGSLSRIISCLQYVAKKYDDKSSALIAHDKAFLCDYFCCYCTLANTPYSYVFGIGKRSDLWNEVRSEEAPVRNILVGMLVIRDLFCAVPPSEIHGIKHDSFGLDLMIADLELAFLDLESRIDAFSQLIREFTYEEGIMSNVCLDVELIPA